jgi:octanoyl-[GcvH]:protein N-octanoyltransferase
LPLDPLSPDPGGAMLRLITDRFAPPALDTAVSSALLRGVAEGSEEPTLRLWVPDRIVAFGRQDRARPGYPQAVAAAREEGFTPVERLAGGRAAVFHEGTIAFSWATPEADARITVTDRFERIASIVAAALSRLGVDARIGEVPGEYCPGSWSVNASGKRKLMGVGQRLVKGGAHVGGVIVVTDPELVNRPLIGAYEALGYEWDPGATGAVSDHVEVGTPEVTTALLEAFAAAGHPTRPGVASPGALARAGRASTEHEPRIA